MCRPTPLGKWINDVKMQIAAAGGERVVEKVGGTPDLAIDADGFLGNREEEHAQEHEETGLQELARKVQKVHQAQGTRWTKTMVKDLSKTLRALLNQAELRAAARDPGNRFAIIQAREGARQAAKQLLETLQPPAEILDSPDFEEMMELLRPPGLKRQPSSFAKGSMAQGAPKSEIALGRVAESIEQADKLVRGAECKMGNNAKQQKNLQQFSQMAFAQMARYLRRKHKALKKKRAGNVEDPDEIAELEEEEDLFRHEMEIFMARARNAMLAIREEIAPRWAPDQQPWLINEADKQVYDIVLASIPEELYQDTQAWGDIQDLRAGHEVFSLRAQDKLEEAAARK